MGFLEIRNLSKTYPLVHANQQHARKGHTYLVFQNLSLSIAEGEFVTVVGHSGCGKSTLLNLIAGFEHPTQGDITLSGEAVTRPGLDRMVVFQNFSLMPWLSAYENIALAVRSAHPKWGKGQIHNWTEKYINLMNLSHAAHKRPSFLSGGMQQRVGLARAFAVSPKILLLDEPFAQIDPFTKLDILAELEWMYYANRNTVMMVTHDVDSALLLSDRILVMSNGPDSKIMDVFEVEIPRPRFQETMLMTEAFSRLRKRILNSLSEGASPQPGYGG